MRTLLSFWFRKLFISPLCSTLNYTFGSFLLLTGANFYNICHSIRRIKIPDELYRFRSEKKIVIKIFSHNSYFKIVKWFFHFFFFYFKMKYKSKNEKTNTKGKILLSFRIHNFYGIYQLPLKWTGKIYFTSNNSTTTPHLPSKTSTFYLPSLSPISYFPCHRV